MKKIIFLSIIFVFSFLSNIVLADFDLGFTYYQQKNFEKAYKEFLEAATYGDHDAQNNIGAMYYRGEFLPQNKILAYAWMALATQSDTYKNAGTYLKIFNKLSDQEKIIAEQQYKEISDEFNDQKIIEKITPNFTSESLNVQKQRIIKIVVPNYPPQMISSGQSGFVDMIFTIDKNGFTRDHVVYYSSDKAFSHAAIMAVRKWRFEPMLLNNIPVAVTGEKKRIKFSFEEAEASDKKVTKAMFELKQKAEQGDATSKLAYGFFLESIPTFAPHIKPIDNPNGIYLQSALAGNPTASYFLGRNILNGNLCTNDNVKSMAWLLKAAKAGLGDAEYMLAIESFSGARFEKNEDKAFYWLEKASAHYDPAKLKYARILSTYPKNNKQNGKLASELIAKLTDDYVDKQTLYQTRASVAAENGDFKSAIKWQIKAIEDAKDLKLPIDSLQKELDSYNTQKPWREEI